MSFIQSIKNFFVSNLYSLLRLLFAILIICFIIQTTKESFWEDFLSNTLATIVGLIVGIPVGLGINNAQEKRTENQKKQKILGALYEELVEDAGYLSKWKDDNIEEKIQNQSQLVRCLKMICGELFAKGVKFNGLRMLKYYSIYLLFTARLVVLSISK
jgi:hypothetical protein